MGWRTHLSLSLSLSLYIYIYSKAERIYKRIH